MIEITFLGTVSGIPSKERNHQAIVLEYYGEKKDTLLFDCGEGTQLQLMKSNISFMDIDRIFISHWHADHFAGLIPLIQTMNLEKRKKELKIFAPEAERFVSDIVDLGYFGLRFPVTAVNIPFEGNDITLVEEKDDWQVLSIPVLHTVPTVAYCFKEKERWNINLSKLKTLGMQRGYWLKKLKNLGKTEYKGKQIKIEDVANVKQGLKIVISGDTEPCENMVKISKGSDLLIHDSTFLEEDEGKSHTDVKQAANIAKKSKVKKLILTHISRRYTDVTEMEKVAKKIFPKTKVAHDFMKVKLKK